ncbi:MAG TPA: hypothetical protein VGH87_28365, partial [Polyangiaceae bacterium]
MRDVATGEALPDFLLRIVDSAGDREDVVTDAASEFATRAKLEEGVLAIEFVDRSGRTHPAAPQNVEHHSADAILDLAVDSGPTFCLDIQPAREIALADLETVLRCVGVNGRFASEPEPVRANESGAWVRFGPLAASRSDTIEVTSRDGFW